MSTRATLNFVWIAGALMGLFMWLGRKTGSGAFILLAMLCALVIICAELYAAHRERTYGDRSETVSPRATVTILAVVALWVGFIVYRAVQH
jgi:hypothetical protein